MEKIKKWIPKRFFLVFVTISAILLAIMCFTINHTATPVIQGAFLLTLISWGIVCVLNNKPKIKKTFYIISSYWMILFILGIILTSIGYYISIVHYFMQATPAYIDALISVGHIIFIASMFNASIQYLYTMLYVRIELKGVYLFVSLALFVLSILLTGKFFQLI